MKCESCKREVKDRQKKLRDQIYQLQYRLTHDRREYFKARYRAKRDNGTSPSNDSATGLN